MTRLKAIAMNKDTQIAIIGAGLGGLAAAIKLKEAGFNVVSYVSDKTGHEFLTWRRSLLELAPMLFK